MERRAARGRRCTWRSSRSTTRSAAAGGDFVYLDPPYAPLSVTARFTSYTAGGLRPDGRRSDCSGRSSSWPSRGASVLLSNSAAPEIRRLYGARLARATMQGCEATTVPARRAINSRASSRGPVREYLITNVSGGPIGGRPAARFELGQSRRAARRNSL